MTIFYILLCSLSVIASIYIENWRINNVHGIVLNIDKRITKEIAIGLYLIASLVYIFVSHEFNFWIILFSGCYTISLRYLLYDPWLNLLQNEYIDYISKTTNSKQDQWEIANNIPFWWQRCIGLTCSILFLFLIHLIK